MTEALKPCPFCGNQPHFTKVEWKDESRYVEVELRCCVIMSEALGWMRARDMTKEQQQAELESHLTLCWNTRYTEETDAN